MIRRPPRSTLFPLHDALPIYLASLGDGDYQRVGLLGDALGGAVPGPRLVGEDRGVGHQLHVCHRDRKSTRLNSSHLVISYAVFCLKKKKKTRCCSSETRGATT